MGGDGGGGLAFVEGGDLEVGGGGGVDLVDGEDFDEGGGGADLVEGEDFDVGGGGDGLIFGLGPWALVGGGGDRMGGLFLDFGGEVGIGKSLLPHLNLLQSTGRAASEEHSVDDL